MSITTSLGRTDARILRALQADPRMPAITLAETLGLSRNTIQARLARIQTLAGRGPLGPGLDPTLLGYPLTAFISANVVQQMLADVAESLAAIPEVIEVIGLSGNDDLLIRTVATDANDLYRIAGAILALPGIAHTSTALAMRSLVPHRLAPLLDRLTNEVDPDPDT